MDHSFSCPCIKCQQEDYPQRPIKLVITAVIAVLAVVFAVAKEATS